MNNNTKKALQEFAEAVTQLAVSVSSVCGTNVLTEVARATEKLQKALDKDETMPEVN